MATKVASQIRFEATLHKPAGVEDNWTFLSLPKEASDQLSSRGMVSVEGTINGFPLLVTLEPDGKGGHWMRVEEELRKGASLKVGDKVALEIRPAAIEPEPKVPADLQEALESSPEAKAVWLDTTAVARRDWIQWITSGKKAETRVKRIEVTLSKLSSGKKRPCCFDRSGMYSNEATCPVASE